MKIVQVRPTRLQGRKPVVISRGPDPGQARAGGCRGAKPSDCVRERIPELINKGYYQRMKSTRCAEGRGELVGDGRNTEEIVRTGLSRG